MSTFRGLSRTTSLRIPTFHSPAPERAPIKQKTREEERLSRLKGRVGQWDNFGNLMKEVNNPLFTQNSTNNNNKLKPRPSIKTPKASTSKFKTPSKSTVKKSTLAGRKSIGTSIKKKKVIQVDVIEVVPIVSKTPARTPARKLAVKTPAKTPAKTPVRKSTRKSIASVRRKVNKDEEEHQYREEDFILPPLSPSQSPELSDSSEDESEEEEEEVIVVKKEKKRAAVFKKLIEPVQVEEEVIIPAESLKKKGKRKALEVEEIEEEKVIIVKKRKVEPISKSVVEKLPVKKAVAIKKSLPVKKVVPVKKSIKKVPQEEIDEEEAVVIVIKKRARPSRGVVIESLAVESEEEVEAVLKQKPIKKVEVGKTVSKKKVPLEEVNSIPSKINKTKAIVKSQKLVKKSKKVEPEIDPEEIIQSVSNQVKKKRKLNVVSKTKKSSTRALVQSDADDFDNLL